MRLPRHLAPCLALTGLLGACAGPDHRAADVRLPARYEAPANSPQLSAATLDHWWLLFNDPALTALEDEAFRTGPDARTQAARILEARAVKNSLIAQTLPQGHIAANASREHEYNIGPAENSLFPIGGTYDSETANLNVSWELDLFGRLAQARKVAKADQAATRFNIEGARASLAASVADNYFLASGYAIQIADARETVRIQTQLSGVASARANLGLAPQSDADRTAGDLAQAKAQAEDLEAQLHAARRQILILIGRGTAPTDSIPIQPLAEDAPPVPDAVPGDLLQRRPDVRESEARLRSEAGTDKLRHLAIFPTFTLLPGLGASRTTQPSVGFVPPATLVPDQQTTELGFWTLGGGVTIPLLDIPRLLFDAKAEDARTEQAVVAYEKVVQSAYGDAENALVNLDAGKRAVATLTLGEQRAHRASDAAETRYKLGFDNLTTALTAETEWRATRAALTSERVQALRRTVVAYKALGGGWAYATPAGPLGGAKAP